MRFSRWFRIEDCLVACMVVGLAGFVGFRLMALRPTLTEEDYWALSFIVSPAALLIFAAACRYAFRPFGSADSQGAVRRMVGHIGRITRDWSPFMLFLLAYQLYQAQVFTTVLSRDRDTELLALDRALFGETPAVLLDGIVATWLTEGLIVAYFLHLVLPPIVAFAWYGKDLRIFREFLLVVVVCGVIGGIGYALVPAVGPERAFPELFHHPLKGALYDPTAGILDKARVQRDVFPSLHVAISSVVLFYGARRGRAWLYVLLPLVLGNWLSTVYLRYHYMIDVVAGWLTAALSIAGARLLLAIESMLLRPGARSIARERQP